MTNTPNLTITLTADQALVLFEWVARENGRGLPVEHPAEQDVLWEIETQLEKTLVEPFGRITQRCWPPLARASCRAEPG